MEYTVESAAAKLLTSFQAYYNIHEQEARPDGLPLRAVCEFYETSQKYVLSQKAELWSENSEEFIFLFSVKNLTKEIFETCRDYAYKEGMKLAHIGPGHMYSYISPVFVCETAEPEAVKALEKCKIYKSFKFSFHGWMDFHVACFEASRRKLHFNHSGLCMKKNLEKVLREELL